MLDLFEAPYTDMFRTMRIKRRPIPTVLHRKTCPDCNRTLVNLYLSNQLDRYICKQCMDKLSGEKEQK